MCHLQAESLVEDGSLSNDEFNLHKILRVSLYPESIRLDRDDVADPEAGIRFD